MAEQTHSGSSAVDVVCSVETFLSQKYDFVVIGGGTAGLAIAARLTENPNVTVGVLEAGQDRRGDLLVDTPGLFLGMLNHPDYEWQYKTTPQVSRNLCTGYLILTFTDGANWFAGWYQWYCSPYSSRQGAWWFLCHQLHDVRPWFRPGL